MNIFALDELQEQTAQWHCNAHVVKMILETAQLLSGVHHFLCRGNDYPIYKPTHLNHPCAIWARQNTANYHWLAKLGLELCKEYTYRYKKVHKSERVLLWLTENVPMLLPVAVEHTPFALAMPDEHKRDNNPVESYRSYYLTKRGGKLGTWKKRNPPVWWR